MSDLSEDRPSDVAASSSVTAGDRASFALHDAGETLLTAADAVEQCAKLLRYGERDRPDSELPDELDVLQDLRRAENRAVVVAHTLDFLRATLRDLSGAAFVASVEAAGAKRKKSPSPCDVES